MTRTGPSTGHDCWLSWPVSVQYFSACLQDVICPPAHPSAGLRCRPQVVACPGTPSWHSVLRPVSSAAAALLSLHSQLKSTQCPLSAWFKEVGNSYLQCTLVSNNTNRQSDQVCKGVSKLKLSLSLNSLSTSLDSLLAVSNSRRVKQPPCQTRAAVVI